MSAVGICDVDGFCVGMAIMWPISILTVVSYCGPSLVAVAAGVVVAAAVELSTYGSSMIVSGMERGNAR